MLSISKYFSKPPTIGDLPLKTYSLEFSQDKLVSGVDNIRHDVHLSPVFSKVASKIVLHLIVRHSQAEHILGVDKSSPWVRERDEFKRLCRDVMRSSVNKAKLEREIQIDFLAQTAIVKMLIRELRVQYDEFARRFKSSIQEYEMSSSQDLSEATRLRETLSTMLQNKKSILRNVGNELFRDVAEVQRADLNELRRANFGTKAILPEDVFSNPILNVEDPSDDFFTIEEYVLLSHRFEDLHTYDNILLLLRSLLFKIDKDTLPSQEPSGQRETILGGESKKPPNQHKGPYDKKIEGWIKYVDNIDIMLNCFQSKRRYKTLKKEKWPKNELLALKKRAKVQRRLLDFFYKEFDKADLIKRIVAFYEIQPVYLEYCPPLNPQQLMLFLVEPRVRRDIVSKLKRLKEFHGKSFSLTPLRKMIKHMGKSSNETKKEYLIRFLKGFARYHRDLDNFYMLKEAMDRVYLASEQKTINLSRANNTLYEFLLPSEHVREEKAIINHVVIKADVRGSTDITFQMKQRDLNPASYFSLNFFDPITEILSEYGAFKVFIEGDAIILSILEREDTPEGWYSVARACGLAITMLNIIQQYNEKNKQHRFPIMEMGIGISYHNSVPTFLFDGNRRIMISPAINQADRLAGCARTLRKLLGTHGRPFNLYVFQTLPEEDISATADDLFFRYNVNGIELNHAGFEKLSKEIDLKVVECMIRDLQEEKIKVYTGTFPTVTGKYKRLVIREGQIKEVLPGDLSVIRLTPRKYYEVCTNHRVYEYVRRMA
jgi:hypothetical protein